MKNALASASKGLLVPLLVAILFVGSGASSAEGVAAASDASGETNAAASNASGETNAAASNASGETDAAASNASGETNANASASFDSELEKLREELADVRKELAKKQDASNSSRKFVSKLGGMIVLDSLSYSQDDENRDFYGDVDNDLFLREARFILKGEGYEKFNYECGVAVQSRNGLFFKNITIGAKDVPILQNVKVGHFKVETGMNEGDALIAVPCATYSSNTMAFSPHRRVGVGSTTFSDDRRIRWFNGVFSGRSFDEEATITTDAPGLMLNTRLTGTPIYRESDEGELEEVVHLGGSFYWCDPSDDGSVRLRLRPTGWINDAPYLLSGSGAIGGGSYNISEVEGAWQKGRLGVLSETFLGGFDGWGSAWGTSLTARCFLEKGCCRTYSKDRGGFAAPRLAHNLGRDGEKGERGGLFPDRWGGWELVATYSYTDMENLKNVPNSVYGNLSETILGLNWWPSPQLRWSLNWNRCRVDAVRSSTGEKTASTNDLIELQANIQY